MTWVRSARLHSSGGSLPITPATDSRLFVESLHFSSSCPSGRRQGWDQFLPMNNVLALVRDFFPRPTHQRSLLTTAGALHRSAKRLPGIYGT